MSRFFRIVIFFSPYKKKTHPPPSRQTPGRPTPDFGSVSVRFRFVWVRLGPFRVHFRVLDGVGERGFCKGKEYHYFRMSRLWSDCPCFSQPGDISRSSKICRKSTLLKWPLFQKTLSLSLSPLSSTHTPSHPHTHTHTHTLSLSLSLSLAWHSRTHPLVLPSLSSFSFVLLSCPLSISGIRSVLQYLLIGTLLLRCLTNIVVNMQCLLYEHHCNFPKQQAADKGPSVPTIFTIEEPN